MNTKRRSFAGADTIGQLAAMLDERGITLWQVQQDFVDWKVWFSKASGCYHARRNAASTGGRFTQHQGDGRRFHVAAASLGRLAVLLLTQQAVDTMLIEENGAVEAIEVNANGDGAA